MNVSHVLKEVHEYAESRFNSRSGKAAAFEAAGYRCKDCIHFLHAERGLSYNYYRCTAFAFGVSHGTPYDFAYTSEENGPCPLFSTSFVTYCREE